jgi:hypothetical protein
MTVFRVMPPLPTLLSHVLLDINREFERVGAEAGEQPSLVLLADLLRVIPDEGISLTDLPPAARISRRAVKAWLGLEKRGWLEVEATAPRVKLVKLTEIGRRARDRWGDLVATTEQDWSAKMSGTQGLRAALEALVGRLDLELPHYPMTYGTADPRAIGGAAVRAKPGPPRIPAHGTDWVPVIRSGTEDVSDLPLHALLSQTLMAFTIDYEERVGFAMAMADILGRAMPTPSVPLDSLPPVLGVNGSGKSLLERHGIVRVAGKDGKRVARLTKVGVWIRDSYEPGIAGVTRTWRDRYGEDVLDMLTANLASADDQLASELPDHVIIRFAVGAGFVDVSFAETG